MQQLFNIYSSILEHVKKELGAYLTAEGNIRRRGPKPKLSDAELIAVSLAAESMSMDSENLLISRIRASGMFPHLIDRSCYNRRRRKLAHFIRMLQRRTAEGIAPDEAFHIIDSLPLPVCQFARAKRSKICRETYETMPDYGYCASQKMTFYGYKLHAVITIGGVLKHLEISRASTADIKYLQDVRECFPNSVILGDRAYLSHPLQLELFETDNISVFTPKRRNQKDWEKYPALFRRFRKRIETLFSQLCDQFMIRRNYAKSFEGLVVRILSKIAALTCAQFVNTFINHKPVNHIKYAW